MFDGLADALLRAAETIAMGVAVSVSGPRGQRNVFVSDAASRLLGYTPDELMARSAASLLAPDEQERFAREGAGPAAGHTTRVDTVVERKDGRRVPVACVTTHVPLGDELATVSFFWDISAQKDLEQARLAERERLERVIAEAPDGIFLLDRELRVLSANRAGAAMLGAAAAADLVGRSVADFVLPDDMPIIEERTRRTLAGEPPPPRVFRGTRIDGASVVAEMVTIPYAYDGQPALLGFARDITERVHMQEQLAGAERLAVLGTLAAGIAHEINNPLMAATLQAEMVRERLAAAGAPSDVTHGLDVVREMHDRIAFIVRDLKAFSRADDAVLEAVDLSQVLAVVLRMLAPTLRGRVEPTVAIDGLPPVRASAFRLEQVFLNLLLNAVQALPEGRPDNRIEVRGRLVPGDRVVVEVVDNGSGIAPADVGRVFTPFFTTKPVGVGTGLGLTVVRDLVSRHGGSVVVQSDLGRGTTVSVELPIAPRTRRAPSLPPAVAAGRRSLVIVDDEPLLVETLVTLLRDRYEVEGYTDAEAALARLVAAPCDLVLCDLMMPGLTGMDLFAHVAAHRPDHAKRFVFMTGGTYTAQASEFLEAERPLHLLKPFTVADVEATFRRVRAS